MPPGDSVIAGQDCMLGNRANQPIQTALSSPTPTITSFNNEAAKQHLIVDLRNKALLARNLYLPVLETSIKTLQVEVGKQDVIFNMPVVI